jgi:hypothetical protein
VEVICSEKENNPLQRSSFTDSQGLTEINHKKILLFSFNIMLNAYVYLFV